MGINLKDEVYEEIREMLAADTTALGVTYRSWISCGENASRREVADHAGIPRGTVDHKFRILNQLVINVDILPGTSAQSLEIAERIRRYKERSRIEIRPETEKEIDRIINDLTDRSRDPELLHVERQKDERIDKKFNQEPGIYVYTYPMYIKHAEVEATDFSDARYHLKVGKTKRTAKIRVKEQTAGMPEAPKPLCLIWGSAKSQSAKMGIDEIESTIHEHLETIGHVKQNASGGGKEWYISNKETIQSIAELMGLEVTDAEDPDVSSRIAKI